tara:strand:- start:1119 stop:2138 length:1020 start_codon:yes stop_codon:yes gene_type:complete
MKKEENKNTIYKTTGFTNTYLKTNYAAVNFYLINAAFGPINSNKKNRANPFHFKNDEVSGCLSNSRYNHDYFRSYKHTKNYSVQINANFFEMKKDFLLYAFLCYKLEKLNEDTSRKHLVLELEIPFYELKVFFDITSKGEKSRQWIFDALNRFQKTQVNITNGNNFHSCQLISGHSIINDNRSITVSFDKRIENIYRDFPSQVFIDLTTYKCIKSERAKKLFVYLFSITYQKLTLHLLRQVLGHEIKSSTGDITYSLPTKKSNAAIKSGFEELKEHGLLKSFKSTGKGIHTEFSFIRAENNELDAVKKKMLETYLKELESKKSLKEEKKKNDKPLFDGM